MKKYYFLFGVILSIVVILSFNLTQTKEIKNKTEITATPITTSDHPFTILLVPGHDTDTGGAHFKDIYERDLVVRVANNISTLLSQDPKYKVIVARDNTTWNPIFADYFTNNEQAILDFKNQQQTNYKLLVTSGQEKVVPSQGEHTLASPKTAIKLYGINKWANENNINLIIHLHFNNSTRKNVKLPGKRHGFDMYIPEKQSVNAATSRTIAENIYKELEKKFSPEAPGYYNSLFEDQNLIALGSFNTLTKPAILIEYAYIYEKVFQIETSQKKELEQMAEQTVSGIKNYVNSTNKTML